MTDLNPLRRDILRAAYLSGTGHVPSSLSCLEIIHTLYTRVMTPDDVFILSKGHAALALYAVLGSIGKLPANWPEMFGKPGALLGHPDKKSVDVFYSGGSLGHGIGYGIGAAIAKRLRNEPGRVFVLVGDGEMQEGSSLEANRLAWVMRCKIRIIVDDNETHAQYYGDADCELDGHDCDALEYQLLHDNGNYPVMFQAHTIKGYGIGAMEADPQKWHHRAPTAEEYAEMLKELQ